MSGFGTLQPRTGNKDSVRLEEVIVLHKWPADEWSQVRFLPGKILPVKRHWITLIAGKDKKEVTVPRYCIAFDVNNENEPRKDAKGKEIKCPYCTLAHGKDASARYEFFYLANAIIREVQEDMPARAKKIEKTKDEKKTGFKDIRSKSWTPVQVCRITSSVAARIKELGDGNFVKKGGEKKAFDVTHEKYGIDIRVKFKPKGAGTDKYSADKDERTPLTDDEKAYLIWPLNDALIDATGRMDVKQAQEDFKRMEVVGDTASSDDDDDEGYSLGDDDGKKSKKKKGDKDKKKKPSKPAFADDDDDDDDEDDSSSKKKSSKSKDKKSKSKDKPKKKAKSDDDDDDEDDSSSKKKSSKTKSKDKVKKSSKDEKSSKKKSKEDKPKKKAKDEKSSKKKSSDKSKSKDKPSKKKKKSSDAWGDDDE